MRLNPTVREMPLADLLDTRRYVETPEGVEVSIALAGPLVRAGAWAIDVAIRGIVNIAFAIIVTLASVAIGEASVGLMLIWAFCLEWFYPVVFEAKFGATPGKKMLQLVVLHDDGTPVGWHAALIRSLLRFVDHLPAVPLFGLVSMGMSPNFKRLGDHAAGTVVAYQQANRPKADLPAVPAIPLPMPLALHEQRAVIDFAQRSQGWTEERIAELAEVLIPIVGGPGPIAARRLQGMARWLLGGR